MRSIQLNDPQRGLWQPSGIAAVNQPPVARLDGVTAATVGNLLTVTASGSYDLDGGSGDPLTYSFDLDTPTGSAATLQVVSPTDRRFTPDETGTHVVTVTVTDDGGASRGIANPIPLSSVATLTIVVSDIPAGGNQRPTASLTGPATATVGGGALTFVASGADPDGDPLTRTYGLTKPVGSNVSLTNVDENTRRLNPDVAGTYETSVTYTDDGGAGRGVVNPVPLSATARVTTVVAPRPSTGERLGPQGVRRVVGTLVVADNDMPAQLEAWEASMGRTVARRDPIRYTSGNLAHFDAAPPLTGWEYETTKLINQWTPRLRSAFPVTLCLIVHLYGSTVSNPSPADRRVYLANLRDGVYDAQWNTQINRLVAAGFAPWVVVRIGHESELTPHRTSAKFTHVTSPGNLAHIREMEALWRDAVEHLMFLWTSRGFKVSYPGNGGWFQPVGANIHLGSGTHANYANMPAWEFGMPNPDLWFDFGMDTYVGGGAAKTFSIWQGRWETLQQTALDLGKPFSGPEWAVWKARNGVSQNFTEAQVTAGLNNFLDFLENTPATGPGSCHYVNYFKAGRAKDVDGVWKYGLSNLEVQFPQSWQRIFVERLGNP